ncbi:MAG TPA: peptidoglycan-binding protein [Acetobacteraceae bacterium]|nr:peptidoglycan-binding protein [Acetobacteraceae bacterium]
MITLNADTMRAIAPRNSGARGRQQATIIDAIGPVLQTTCADYGIDTALRLAHFLAQICHESDGFCTTQEYATGDAYEGRADLGNTQHGDGPRFKGRGLIQLTGRANYGRYGNLLQLDLVGNPSLAAEPATSLLIACAFWKQQGLDAFADADDILTITRRINGGLNGIDDRRARLTAAKSALGLTGDPTETPTIRRGDSGAGVVRLQNLLRSIGYPLTADGDFGPTTDEAVRQFQTSKGLAADGLVGPATWSALGASASG